MHLTYTLSLSHVVPFAMYNNFIRNTLDGLNGSWVWQTLLENAMRSVDKTLEDRWDRIADLIPNRSRKEVVSRVKDVKKMLASSLAS